MAGGMHGRGYAWQRACVVGGYIVGGVCGRGHEWQGVCMAGGHVWCGAGMHGRGAW